MKFIHTSDWHLGQDFYGYDRSLEHRAFIGQISDIACREQADALLIAGDIYHSPTPSNATVRLFNEGLMQIHKASPDMKIIIIAGNHDSASKLHSDGVPWAELNVTVVSSVMKDSDASDYIIQVPGKGLVVAVPYTYKSNFPAMEGVSRDDRRKEWFSWILSEADRMNTGRLPVVLMMHDAVNGCDFRGHDERIVGGLQSADFSEISIQGDDCGFDYLALGHIHHPQTVSGTDSKAVYCGSPVAVSFDEDYEHHVNVVSIGSRGDAAEVDSVSITNPVPVVTVPDAPARIADVLTALSTIDRESPCYLRANILRSKAENVSGYPETILKALGQDSQVRYCCMALETEGGSSDGIYVQNNVSLTIDEFRSKEPLDMARTYYTQAYDEPLPKEMEDMLMQAIREDSQNQLGQ